MWKSNCTAIAVTVLSISAMTTRSQAQTFTFAQCAQGYQQTQGLLPQLQPAKVEWDALINKLQRDPRYQDNDEAYDKAISAGTPLRRKLCPQRALEVANQACNFVIDKRAGSPQQVAQAQQMLEFIQPWYGFCNAQ